VVYYTCGLGIAERSRHYTFAANETLHNSTSSIFATIDEQTVNLISPSNPISIHEWTGHRGRTLTILEPIGWV